MPMYFELFGANKFNDIGMMEQGHEEDKAVFDQVSKRYKSTLSEMINKVRML
jgi:hypothetical protein